MKFYVATKVVPVGYLILFLTIVGAIAALEQVGWWPAVGVVALGLMGLLGNVLVARHESGIKAAAAASEVLDDLPHPAVRDGKSITERRPSQILSADFLAAEKLFPFWGRASALSELQTWATDARGPWLSILSGPTLVGKTRLSIELAASLPEEWRAGRLRMQFAGGAVASLSGVGRPALIIVEASSWHQDLPAFLSDAARHNARLNAADSQRRAGITPLRVLLVTRSERWLPAVREKAPDLAETLHNALRVTLTPFGSDANQAEWLRTAGLRFAGQPVPAVARDPRAAGRAYRTESIGELLARAVLASRTALEADPGRVADSPARVADALAEHERSQWPDPEPGIVISRTLRMRAVAAILLLEPTTHAEACAVLAKIPELEGGARERLADIANWVAEIYPSDADSYVSRPTSTLLTAGLIDSAVSNDAFWSAITPALPVLPRAQVAAFLLEVSDVVPAAAARAESLLRRLDDSTELRVMLATLGGVTQAELADALVADLIATGAIPALQAAELADDLDGYAMPRAHIAGIRARLTLAQKGETPSRIAKAHSALGAELSRFGHFGDALPHKEEAVRLLLDLAEENPDRYNGDLANAALDLGVGLSDVGRYRDALPHKEEAVRLLRDLSKDNPDRYTGDLANAVRSLAVGLSDRGRYRDALPHEEEAVRLLRDLSKDNPDRYAGDLAKAVRNLGIGLADVGRYRDALPHGEQAVCLLRGLFKDDPDRYTGELASAMLNLGSGLSELGRHDDALLHEEEAVRLFEDLATANPDRYTGDLANAMVNFGAGLCEVGRSRDAIPQEEKAVILLRNLTTDSPDRYTGDLANAVLNLGSGLSGLGRHDDALPYKEEAVRLLRDLSRDNPDRYTGDLANAVLNLGVGLFGLGRHNDALPHSVEAVRLFRYLTNDYPDRYTGDLAAAALNLGAGLSEMGRHHEALPSEEEAVRLFRRLDRNYPDRYASGLATAVWNLGQTLAALGRDDDLLRLGISTYP